METKTIYVLGIGRNTPVFYDLLTDCGYTILGLYHFDDSRTGEHDHGFEIMGSFEDLWRMNSLEGMNFVLSQGNNQVRADVFNRILSKGGNLPTIIHPSAHVSQYATLGQGVIVHMNAIVHPDVVIGDDTVLSYNTAVTHSSSIGKHCYMAANAMVGAYVHVDDYAFIGIGASVVSGKVQRIGLHATVGAGALVVKDVADYDVVAGVPARVMAERTK
ncbi:MAG: NeuD/PglB/VioB family sugar acetyltransferase [Paludibacteraceae bacterium]